MLDAFGHVSARHPQRPDRFLLPRRVPPSLVTAEDIREFTLEGALAEPDGTPVFIERFIHSEIYAARPDVQAIIHAHAPASVTFSVLADQPLRAICHTCGFLGTGVPRFEIRNVAGTATDLLIRNRELGRALALCLGGHAVVLMRGHGCTAVGGSVAQAVYRAVYTETNARIQSAAGAIGAATFLTLEEAEAAEATAALQAERCWQAWTEEIAGG